MPSEHLTEATLRGCQRDVDYNFTATDVCRLRMICLPDITRWSAFVYPKKQPGKRAENQSDSGPKHALGAGAGSIRSMAEHPKRRKKIDQQAQGDNDIQFKLRRKRICRALSSVRIRGAARRARDRAGFSEITGWATQRGRHVRGRTVVARRTFVTGIIVLADG